MNNYLFFWDLHCVSNENKLISSLLWPERLPKECFASKNVSREHADDNHLRLQSQRTMGFSQVNQNFHPCFSDLCSDMVSRADPGDFDLKLWDDFRHLNLPCELYSDKHSMQRRNTHIPWVPKQLVFKCFLLFKQR